MSNELDLIFQNSPGLIPDDRVAVIAEIGANHNGDPATARKMLDAIADTGAKLVKFQLYTADELVADTEIEVTWGPPGNTTTESVGAMFDRISLPAKAYPSLFQYARTLGLIPFATPFSEDGVEYLESLKVPLYKIASSDVSHLKLLKSIARTGKPVILSVGKSTLADVDLAVNCLRENNCTKLAILHCVASYPTPMEEMNLRNINLLKTIYPDAVIGFSDHSQGITAAIASVAIGARIIEKHVTLDQDMNGPDHWFSLSMNQLKSLVSSVNDACVALGSPTKRVQDSEVRGRQIATRSLIAVTDLPEGHIMTHSDVKIVRPGTGIEPRLLDAVIGLRLTKPLTANHPITWDVFK